METQVKQHLTEVIEEVWQKVQEEFLQPFLSTTVGNSAQPASLIKHRIELSLPFIDEMRKIGVEPYSLIDLLLAREVNAWFHIPSNFFEYLKLYYHTRSIVYKEDAASQALEMYLHIWNDVDLALNHDRAERLLHVYQASIEDCAKEGVSAADDLYRLLSATVSWRLGDKAIQLRNSPRHTLALQIAELDYLKPESRATELKTFAAAISRIFFVEKTKKPHAATTGEKSKTGDEEDSNKPKPRWPLGQELQRDTNEFPGIEAGLKRFLGKLGDQRLFDQVLDSLTKDGISQIGRWWYYRELAAQYQLQILKGLKTSNSQVYPVELSPWQPGSDDIWLLNVHASFGKPALPMLTKVYRLSGVDSALQEPGHADLVLMMDSSGSMGNPNAGLSYAVLGGTIATQAYLNHGSEVAVYNFSSSDLVLDFTRDETRILKHIIKYQAGGTTLNPSVIDRMLRMRRRSGRPVDILIITDLGISNLDRVLQKISEVEDTHRIFLFAIGAVNDATLKLFEGSKVIIYQIKDKADIPGIVLGAVQQTFQAEQGEKNGAS